MNNRSEKRTPKQEFSINEAMNFARDRKHGTMSRRIARNQVTGRFVFGG